MFYVKSRLIRFCAFALTPMYAVLICGVNRPVEAQRLLPQVGDAKARLSAPYEGLDQGGITVSPITLRGGSKLTLISPDRWAALGSILSAALEGTHSALSEMLGELPPVKSSLRLMDEDTFRLETGAPSWTNALYYRGEIMIPLARGERPDIENLERSVRHEYTHAVLNTLSAGRCPGWLDEGFAQWIEGVENPALRPALSAWLSQRPPISLSLLQGGFTKLNPAMVPAAYAQALFSSTVVVNTFGFSKLRRYLDALRVGSSRAEAFMTGFEISEREFELRLRHTLQKWNASYANQRNHLTFFSAE